MSNLYSYYTQVLFISFIFINHVVEIYLSRRQLAMYQKHKDSPPQEFTEFLTNSDHHKAIEYSTAKLKMGQFHLIYDACLLLYWFPMRGAERLYFSIPLEGMHKEVFFLVTFTGLQFLLNLPWSVF